MDRDLTIENISIFDLKQAGRIASLTGSMLNLVVILLLSRLYTYLAQILTQWGKSPNHMHTHTDEFLTITAKHSPPRSFRNAPHSDQIRGRVYPQGVRLPVCQLLLVSGLHCVLQGQVGI